jgi:protein-S-isoprenylcysteine O-methyltransferase Ste14
MYLSRVSAEEEMMTERFGEVYSKYMNKTGGLFPRLKVKS